MALTLASLSFGADRMVASACDVCWAALGSKPERLESVPPSRLAVRIV